MFRSVVPAEYAGARPPDVPAVSRIVPGSPGYGACFGGNPGIGKTYAATALAWSAVLSFSEPVWQRGDVNAWRYRSAALVWVSAPYLLARIRDTYRKNPAEREKDVIDECIAADVFLLDDLGAEKQSEHGAATLYTILSGRRNHRRFTIVTTNQPFSAIEAWEPRIASRLGEMELPELPDVDRRLRS